MQGETEIAPRRSGSTSRRRSGGAVRGRRNALGCGRGSARCQGRSKTRPVAGGLVFTRRRQRGDEHGGRPAADRPPRHQGGSLTCTLRCVRSSAMGDGPELHDAERAILDLLARRDPGTTICPSDAARALGGDGGFRPLMPLVRGAAAALVATGQHRGHTARSGRRSRHGAGGDPPAPERTVSPGLTSASEAASDRRLAEVAAAEGAAPTADVGPGASDAVDEIQQDRHRALAAMLAQRLRRQPPRLRKRRSWRTPSPCTPVSGLPRAQRG